MKTNFKLGQNGLLTLKGTLSTNFVNMRNYKKKTNRNTSSSLQDKLRAAATGVILEKRSIRGIEKQYGVCHVKLYRVVKKLKGVIPCIINQFLKIL